MIDTSYLLFLKALLTAVALMGLLHTRSLPMQPIPGKVQEERFVIGALLKQGRWRSLIFGVLVFPLLYGLMAQICDSGQISNGLFDVTSELVGIAFLTLLVLVGALGKRPFDPEAVFIVLLPVFATAMLLLPLFWNNEVFVAGLVMKCGFTVYQPLLWVCLCNMVRDRPNACFMYFGITIGIFHLMIMIGRLCAQAFGSYAGLSDAALAVFSLAAVWMLSLVSLAMLLLRRWSGKKGDAKGSQDAFSNAFDLFVRRYSLSEREAAVCHGFARGRTVDYIARQLVVSPETVKTHLKRAYGKTGCHSRQDLIDSIERCSHEPWE